MNLVCTRSVKCLINELIISKVIPYYFGLIITKKNAINFVYSFNNHFM